MRLMMKLLQHVRVYKLNRIRCSRCTNTYSIIPEYCTLRSQFVEYRVDAGRVGGQELAERDAVDERA